MKTITFNKDNTVFQADCKDWRSAVAEAGNILVKQNCATPNYVDNIIKSIEEYGPYVVIADGIAIPHTRPEDGALTKGCGLLTLKKSVFFDGNPTPVNVLISFSAVDKDSHIDILQEVVGFINEGLIEDIAHAKNFDEFLQITERSREPQA